MAFRSEAIQAELVSASKITDDHSLNEAGPAPTEQRESVPMQALIIRELDGLDKLCYWLP